MGYEIFERLCKEKGVKPVDVSRETKTSTATFSNWKQGKYTPKYETLEKIAKYFDVSVEFLKTGRAETGYYLDEKTAEVAQEIFDTPGMRILFDQAKGSKPENLMFAAELLKKLKETNQNG